MKNKKLVAVLLTGAMALSLNTSVFASKPMVWPEATKTHQNDGQASIGLRPANDKVIVVDPTDEPSITDPTMPDPTIPDVPYPTDPTATLDGLSVRTSSLHFGTRLLSIDKKTYSSLDSSDMIGTDPTVANYLGVDFALTAAGKARYEQLVGDKKAGNGDSSVSNPAAPYDAASLAAKTDYEIYLLVASEHDGSTKNYLEGFINNEDRFAGVAIVNETGNKDLSWQLRVKVSDFYKSTSGTPGNYVISNDKTLEGSTLVLFLDERVNGDKDTEMVGIAANHTTKTLFPEKVLPKGTALSKFRKYQGLSDQAGYEIMPSGDNRTDDSLAGTNTVRLLTVDNSGGEGKGMGAYGVQYFGELTIPAAKAEAVEDAVAIMTWVTGTSATAFADTTNPYTP